MPIDAIKELVDKVQDASKRREERYTPSGLSIAIADELHLLNTTAWDRLVDEYGSVFMSRAYLNAVETAGPSHVRPRYALVSDGKTPVMAMSMQIAEVNTRMLVGDKEMESAKEVAGSVGKKLAEAVLEEIEDKVLVCGNLLSSGCHGLAIRAGTNQEQIFQAVSEVLYRVRRAERLRGTPGYVLIKDLPDDAFPAADTLRTYSYRPIRTDPDMVLELEPSWNTFDDYLASLTAKYRSRLRKQRKAIDGAGYVVKTLTLGELQDLDSQLNALYKRVVEKAQVRLAPLPEGYFAAMGNALGERFRCTVIQHQDGSLAGFVTSVKDRECALAYYVGVDYEVNAKLPIYFRLLQVVVEDALHWGSPRLYFGRTALEPKAVLGAKPEATQIWLRHRAAPVNFVMREFFSIIPHDEAPERNPFKKKK